MTCSASYDLFCQLWPVLPTTGCSANHDLFCQNGTKIFCSILFFRPMKLFLTRPNFWLYDTVSVFCEKLQSVKKGCWQKKWICQPRPVLPTMTCLFCQDKTKIFCYVLFFDQWRFFCQTNFFGLHNFWSYDTVSVFCEKVTSVKKRCRPKKRICQPRPVLQTTTFSANHGLFCQPGPALPIMTCSANYDLFCQLWPVLPIMACSANYDLFCQLWPVLPIMACSANYVLFCQIWPVLPTTTCSANHYLICQDRKKIFCRYDLVLRPMKLFLTRQFFFVNTIFDHMI